MEHNVKNVPTVTMETHSSQAAAASRARVTTTLIRQISATVIHLLEDVLLVCTIPQALAASAVNRVTMVTPLLGIAQNAFATAMARIPVLLTRVITRQASASVSQTSSGLSATSAPTGFGTWAAGKAVRSVTVVERARLKPPVVRMVVSVNANLDMEAPVAVTVRTTTGEHRWQIANRATAIWQDPSLSSVTVTQENASVNRA